MDKKRKTRSEMMANAPPIEHWPTASDSNLEVKEKEIYQNRCNAIRKYYEGEPVADIEKVTGISRGILCKYAANCLELAEDGRIWGFRALLPYFRIRNYKRTAKVTNKLPEAKGGMSGAFRKILNQFPDVEKKLIDHIEKNNSSEQNVHEKKIRAKTLHKIFLQELKKKGVQQSEWPFNTKYRAFKTIQNYLNEILNESFGRTVYNREEQSAIAHLAVGTGFERLLIFENPYDAVELDAYCIDAFFSAEFETPEGSTTHIQLERIWLIAMIEVVSSAVLAYSVVYSSEVCTDDVIEVIKKAVNPQTRIQLSIPGLSFPEVGGFPSEVFAPCKGAIWGALLLDGALAHLSNAVHSRVRKALGIVINWGPVGHFERRPNIERYFKTISEEIFKRLPSTTGLNPGKGRAENAEQNAVKYKINAEEVEQLVAVFTAQYNATPTEGNSYNSPLDILRHYIEGQADHFLIKHAPIKRGSSSVLIPFITRRKVRGSRATGRRPYVQVDGPKYTNTVLSQSPGLIGKYLTLEFEDEEDWRYCKAYLEDGKELGILKVCGRWYLTKHSRKTRKIINKLIAKRILVVGEHDDPVQVYLKYKSTQNNKRSNKTPQLTPSQATEATRISKESGLKKQIVKPDESMSQKEKSLQELQKSQPSLISGPMPDLNQLIKSNRKL